jgi:hypothetical protein
MYLAEPLPEEATPLVTDLADPARSSPVAPLQFLRCGGSIFRFVDSRVVKARAAAAPDHPCICHINEVAEYGGKDFIVMEYNPRIRTLRFRLRREDFLHGLHKDTLRRPRQLLESSALRSSPFKVLLGERGVWHIEIAKSGQQTKEGNKRSIAEVVLSHLFMLRSTSSDKE